MMSGNVLYQLSESQKSIWYLEKAHPGTSINMVAANLRLRGDVDYPSLEKSLNVFVKKNDSMRIRITEEDGEVYQYVTEYEAFKIDFFDFSQDGGLKKLFAWDEETTHKPFDIVDNQLFYCAIYKISETEGGAYMKMHHLISDAWTMGLLARQLVDVYSAVKNGLGVDETPYPSFVDHIRQEEEYEKSGRFIKDRKYWEEKFETLPEMTVLRPRKSGADAIRAKRKTMTTPVKFSNKLRMFSREHHLSVFTLFMAALAIYINRVAGFEDMVLGTTILNRVNFKDKQTTGMFVSVAAPIRITLDDAMDFETFAGLMLKESTEVLKHQKYPYNYLIRELKKKHKFTGRLFDIVLSYQNAKFHKHESDEDYVAKWLFSGYQIESLVISINDREDEGNLLIDYDFLTDVYSVKEIEFIHQHILSLLWHALDNPSRRISKLEMISEREKRTILHDFNDTAADFPGDKTIHQIFEEQAERTPDSVALVLKDQTMTYRQLNESSNRLARTLRAEGVGPDDVVGLIVDRSFEMIIGILAVLKAGGAYMPMDPGYPEERIRFMLENSGAQRLLTKRTCLGGSDYNVPVIDLGDATAYAADTSDLEPVNKPADLAYIIYTSGSTGRPKGAMIEHRNLVGLLFNDRFGFDFNASDVWTLFHSYCFDFTVWEMYGSLLRGGKLVIVTRETALDQSLYLELLKKERVTVLNQTPQSMYNLIELEMQTEQRQLSIRYVFLGGEALKPSMLNPLRDRYPQAQFTNLYGPTESTIFVTLKRLTQPEDFSTNLSNIGTVVPMMKAYVLDGHMNLLPIGITGELYVSGNGVGRGYINNPGLTAERFLESPFDDGGTLYKTGDLVRLMPKGDIIYLGRADSQVKIRGYRIELGEIENALLNHPGIDEAVLTVFESAGGSRMLCAYYKAETEFTSKDLTAYLAGRLPDYMIPSVFIKVETFPMNRSGKIDKSKLPEPYDNSERPAPAAPRNQTEIKLLEIWREVLGIDGISVADDFFFIGGDSLNALKVTVLVGKYLEVEVSPRDLFRYRTVRALGEYIAGLAKTEYSPIPIVNTAPYYPVSSAQKRQYILHEIDGGLSYNLPGGLRIDGAADRDRLEQAFRHIVGRHEALRTSFDVKDGEPVQFVHDSADLRIEHETAGEEELGERMAAFVRPFDLSRAPLLRVKLISFSPLKHVLLYDMHHIVSDGASVNILVREFVRLYNGDRLPELRVQYKDFAAWHNKLLQSEKMERQQAYWLEQLSGELPVLNMPTDFPRPPVQSFRGSRLRFTVDAQLTERIKSLAARTGTTLFMLLFSAYNVLLARYTGQEDIVVGTPVEGRRHEDLSGIVGMFVGTLAVRSRPVGDKSFEAFLGEVKTDLINAYENQDYPFEMLLDKAGIKRDASRNPLFDTMFVLQNTDLSVLTEAGFTAEFFEYENNTAKFDLTVEALDEGDTIQFNLEYCTDLYRPETVERMAAHFINILTDISRHPSRKLRDIELLSEPERRRLLVDFNDTAADFPTDKTIHQLFEEQAERTPDSIALVLKDQTMTYRQLNESSNRLARTLRTEGVGPDDVVGLIVDRSFEMIIAILAVLKAGGAYMPIDPDYPEERKAYILENSGAKLLLTISTFSLDFYGLTLNLDDESLYKPDCEKLISVSTPSNLAYIIYTSGSTGTPKGVMMEHQNVIGLLFNTGFCLNVTSEDVWTLFHSYCFDFSAFETYGALLRGGKLVIVPHEATKDLTRLHAILKKERVTVLCQTPHSMYNFVDIELQSRDRALCLRYIIIGGEVLKPKFLRPIHDRYPETILINIYGPTETTIFVTKKILKDSEDFTTDLINIGPPNPLTCIYVLDKYLNMVPIGVPGEIYVSGNGISRGYLNNPTLTQERFIENPFDSKGTLYKTGDTAKWLPTGELDYVGRIDNQVKIRGFRIELEEIESNLLKHGDIEDATVVVIATTGGEKKLCAYFKSGTELTPDDLSVYLRKRLPFYMIPAFFIRLDTFPLSRNKKVDKSKLPDPFMLISSSQKTLPNSEIQKTIAAVWSEVLEISPIGIDENFFELGGDSLSAVKIVSKLKLGIKLIDFYAYPTIRALAEHLSAAEKNSGLLVNMTEHFNLANCNVVCIPFGGGSPISYKKISEAAAVKNVNLNIYSVKLPGSDYGINEELENIDNMAQSLAAEVMANIKGELILYGHCAGSALMTATARLLEKSAFKIKAVLIGGIFAPKYIKLYGWFDKPVGFYTDNSIRSFLKTAGLAGDMLDNKDYLSHMRKVLRHAKLEYNKFHYQFIQNKANRIKTQLYLVVGDEDAATKNYTQKYRSWNRYFENVKLFVLKNADHFFINTHHDQLVELFQEISHT